MKNAIILEIILLCAGLSANSQDSQYRSGIFLHHSTGGCIWGPNGSPTDVPEQMNFYNIAHGYTGDDAVTLSQTWYPAWNNNEWSTWHSIFETDAPEVISGILNANKIVMIKSCYPSSQIYSIGSNEDTLDPSYKSIVNYKWHWRHIVKVMENHPDNFFVIWTNAPLELYSTNATQAAYSNWFCYWAKDTLAQNLDPVYGVFPPNVYVFDFFHKLADANGFLPQYYASGPGNSHPNAAATELVAPQLVNETFDAAIAYESILRLDIKVFLEGPFNGINMNIDLIGLNDFPFSQPYNVAPWNYLGSEIVTTVPSNVVDWILVELRDATAAATATAATRIARQAAFLMNDGCIRGLDGTSNQQFDNLIIQHSLFIVLWHRNHLGIMSALPVTQTDGVYFYDFTTGSGQAYGINAQKNLGSGIYGMYAGDFNADGSINPNDKTNPWNISAGKYGYLQSDGDFDGQADNKDKNDFWFINNGKISLVPQ